MVRIKGEGSGSRQTSRRLQSITDAKEPVNIFDSSDDEIIGNFSEKKHCIPLPPKKAYLRNQKQSLMMILDPKTCN
ncbi:hypothetical protein RND71_035497 [Anisodus tanguticus]|uniref:Uncharacterized protein n=1 Tax=Anisodus tanguticus TaxID=243964 RepID=A0AAE1R5N0_9SOLA|nr:hypothetical protein RND71_035497 [Anisodus tanguticus]